MALKGKTTDDFIRILEVGGGIRFDAIGRTTAELIHLATVAKSGGARLVLMRMSSRETDDLIRIAAAGGGQVIFED